MRALVRFASILVGLALLVPAASAADFNHYTGRWTGGPGHYGSHEPWSRKSERPPRKGHWYFISPVAPTVNFLVPRLGRTLTPWTPEWEAYCASRWQSFNPRTGTVVTPDGVRMCF